MDETLATLSSEGSYSVLVLGLLLGAIGLPVPEEVVLLAGGVLAHRGSVVLPLLIAVLAVALLAADTFFYALGRRFGAAAARRRPLRWILPPARRARLERLFARHGWRVVAGARFLPGLRATLFLLSGMHGVPVRRFVLSDLAAILVYVPAVVLVGFHASASVDRVRDGLATAQHALVLVAAGALAAWGAVTVIRGGRRRTA